MGTHDGISSLIRGGETRGHSDKGHVRAGKKALTRNQSSGNLDLGLPGLQNCETYIPAGQVTQSTILFRATELTRPLEKK